MDPIETPCTGVCAMDLVSGLCFGCRRTLDEIAGWSAMSGPERTRIMAALRSRDSPLEKRGAGGAPLILASASPRRAEILRHAGFEFAACAVGADETVRRGEPPEEYVTRLARAKARMVAEKLGLLAAGAVVLGADTAVVIEGEILGKPADEEDARRMLVRLAGRAHEVLSGLCLMAAAKRGNRARIVAIERTRVTFAPLSAGEIEEYVATGEPMDKAGAYGIQGAGGKFITRIEGCYFNVMGLPLSRLYRALRELRAD